MHLIQLLLPLQDNHGHAYPEELFKGIRAQLVDRFGGLTAFTRAPAEGIWMTGGARTRDNIIIVEVMVDRLDRNWWSSFRISLESALNQKSVVVRCTAIELL